MVIGYGLWVKMIQRAEPHRVARRQRRERPPPEGGVRKVEGGDFPDDAEGKRALFAAPAQGVAVQVGTSCIYASWYKLHLKAIVKSPFLTS
jgi:hypothetical protein